MKGGMTETEALCRIAAAVGLELCEIPADMYIKSRWYLAKGNARYTRFYFSPEKMLESVLKLERFARQPGTWDRRAALLECPNPFCGLTPEELELTLAARGEAK